MMIETRVTGTQGSAWIDGVGDRVFVADVDGTRRIAVEDDLRGDVPPGVATDLLDTEYERMIAHGLDLLPYTRLAETFAAMINGLASPGSSRAATFEDGLRSLEVLQACRESAVTGRWARVGRG